MLTVEQTTARILEARMDLISCVYSVTRDFHLAEDIYQEMFVKAVSMPSTFDSVDHLLNWFRLGARHRAIDVIRKSKGQYTGLSEDTLSLLEQDHENTPREQTNDFSEALRRCLQSLTPRSRSIVEMRYFENRSSQEIAEFIGGKVESAYQAISRIHKTLKDCMERQFDGDCS